MHPLFELSTESILALGPVGLALVTMAFFVVIYFGFALLSFCLLTRGGRWPLFQNRPYRPGQIAWEIRRSLVSILMFGLLSLPLYEGLRVGWLRFAFEFSPSRFFLEAFVLFLWNEVYFYAVHRTFHLKPLYKWHSAHHDSVVPSPFSAYSFHWTEGLALGAVMPVAMLFHDFLFWSLMTLPLMSIFMNVLGHSNVDFFPERPLSSLLSFSRRHSLHHKNPRGNFGFFLPHFDRWLGTAVADDAAPSPSAPVNR